MGDGDVGGAAANDLAYALIHWRQKCGEAWTRIETPSSEVHPKTAAGVNRLPWPQYHAKPHIFVPNA